MAEEGKVSTVSSSPFRNSYWPWWLKWCPTSHYALEAAESRIFSYVKNKLNLFFVPIKNSTLYIRTMIAYKSDEANNEDYKNRIPIVMIHGMGSGIGLWCRNIDPISNYRKMYAIDVLGFGYSSRPQFPNDPKVVEDMLVDSFEEWRQKLEIDKFILLGHSMGGYLAYAYALKYPEKVRHLILADPWGFSKFDSNRVSPFKKNPLLRGIFAILKALNPLAAIRFAGPFGPGLIRKFRPDLGQYFQLEETDELLLAKPSTNREVYDYIYHCNAQFPSGEMAFKILSYNIGWAHNPMIDRASELDESVPITFLYGEESWMDLTAGMQFQQKRVESFVDVQIIPDVGHHVYVEDADDFNKKVNNLCKSVDKFTDALVVTDLSAFNQKTKRNTQSRNRTVKRKSKTPPTTEDK